MPYTNFQGMPEDLHAAISAALEIEFSNPNHGSWRTVADRINATFGTAFDGEFIREKSRRRARRNNKSEEGPTPIYTTETPIAARDFEGENGELRQVNTRLFRDLQKARNRTEALVQATFQGAYDAMISSGPMPQSPRPKLDTRPKDKEAALWHMTDWQGGKLTTSYNFEVMRERVLRFCHKAELITQIQRADHPVKECVLCFGGDMIEGLFNFPTQAFEIDGTIFEQYVRVTKLVIEVVRYALMIYDHVTVVSEWGNHGRIGSKRDNVPRNDNFDRMVYEFARTMLENEERLTWNECGEDIQRIEIGNYRALLIHGDEVGRNGFASPMTIVRHADRWRSGSYNWDFRDVYVGHYHNHNEWSMANGTGTVFQSGSTESDNRYARDTMAASAVPTQRLHFIDKERGRVSAQYKIYVDGD